VNLTSELKKLLKSISDRKIDNNRVSHNLAGSVLLQTCTPSETDYITKQAYMLQGHVKEATLIERELTQIVNDLQEYCEVSDIEGSLQSVINRVEFVNGKSKVYRKSWDINGKDKTRIISVDIKYNIDFKYLICKDGLSTQLTVEDICANDWTSYTEVKGV